MSRSLIRMAVVLAVITVLAFAMPVLAKGPGGGGGGGGGGHTETATNSLSVPAIMIGGGFTNVTPGVDAATAPLTMPVGVPLTGYTIDPIAHYYVQGVHKWQAQCFLATAATGTAAWGDNLSGDAKLKVGSPIRVELGLFDGTGVTMNGFTVAKLEPEKLDRESRYGTLATSDGIGGFYGTTTAFSPVRIYDAGATFSIRNVATGDYVVQPGSNPTAEINAGGAIVYGYNLRVPSAGLYAITFSIPAVTITGVDAGTYFSDPTAPDTVTIEINVVGGGGGGGRP